MSRETSNNTSAPEFCQGIQYFAEDLPQAENLAVSAVIALGQSKIDSTYSEEAVYQTMLCADALRYLTLHVTGSKGSGHPGDFASSADVYASLVMLGHTNIVTEVGHHAPGFYSAMFLDTSLQEMGMNTVDDMCERFRECEGLLGHLSRGMAAAQAADVTREVCRNLKHAMEKLQGDGRLINPIMVSRSDSTLRGHYPVETDVIAEQLGPFDAHFLVPAFFEGGRFTRDSTHYLLVDGEAVPVVIFPGNVGDDSALATVLTRLAGETSA